ncbi:TPA: hypothetical protein ACGEB1_002332 [Yersinia enterocolitica]
MSEIKQYDTEVRLEAVMGTNHYGVHIHAMTTEDLHSKSGIAVELAWRDLRIKQRLRTGDKSKRPVPKQAVPPTPVKTVKSVKTKVRKIMEAA